ncbi:SMI1/KNR4 family protein [Telmatospirillum siberiense]|uniref:Knr4/Smi1-like domain-containing protein n=1 Tax=Telmatospirillum siberiense TaxID=382514 RepID=A0A2N3PNH9_9PROT|nr:SMI1/KNR4 family protein [Telmatospirillum siberiense]PKU21961.1 hypothetical protein CWS72_23955 [Telmatospirillum siberiense]
MTAVDYLKRANASLFSPSPVRDMVLDRLEMQGAVTLPQDYRSFLAASDGAMFGEGMLYGCEAHVDPESRVPLICLSEGNPTRRVRRHVAVLGEFQEDLIIFDGAVSAFALANRVDHEAFESAASLIDLLKMMEI